jgi:hypothetical protein
LEDVEDFEADHNNEEQKLSHFDGTTESDRRDDPNEIEMETYKNYKKLINKK